MELQIQRSMGLGLLLLFAGCSHQNPTPLTQGGSITLTSDASAASVDLSIRVKRSRVERGIVRGVGGTVAGAAAGAAVGAVAGVVACPGTDFCRDLFATLGAVPGGITGGVLGATSTRSVGVDKRDSRALSSIAAQLLTENRISAELEKSFIHSAAGKWHLEPDSPHQVTLHLISLSFYQPDRERVGLRLKTRLEVKANGRKKTITLVRKSPPVSVHYWLDGGNYLEQQLGKMIRATAQGMMEALVAASPR